MIAVVTTIRSPTQLLRHFNAKLQACGGRLVVIGDRSSPERFELENAEFYSLEQQLKLPFQCARLLPVDNYARKNVGYLVAMMQNAKVLYETDDDNEPMAGWVPRELHCEAQPVERRRWVNVYRIFSDEEHLWPRGFPLDRVRDADTFAHDTNTPWARFEAPIQQGLHDGDPDTDAVWRLTVGRRVTFKQGLSMWLPPGTWAPVNSQSTWFWPVAFVLAYNPVHCPPRMPDIWRGFVASRCMWELGCGIVYHSPEVVQERNRHDLMSDLRAEVDGYLNYDRLVGGLEDLELRSGEDGVGPNMLRCYEKLVGLELVGKDELPLVRAWLDDVALAHRIAEGGVAS